MADFISVKIVSLIYQPIFKGKSQEEIDEIIKLAFKLAESASQGVEFGEQTGKKITVLNIKNLLQGTFRDLPVYIELVVFPNPEFAQKLDATVASLETTIDNALALGLRLYRVASNENLLVRDASDSDWRVYQI